MAAVTSTHITERHLPILSVTHYDDDHSWGFQSGLNVTMAEAQVVSMKEVLLMDSTVAEIADLPPGHSARRDRIGGEWTIHKDEWDDDES